MFFIPNQIFRDVRIREGRVQCNGYKGRGGASLRGQRMEITPRNQDDGESDYSVELPSFLHVGSDTSTEGLPLDLMLSSVGISTPRVLAMPSPSEYCTLYSSTQSPAPHWPCLFDYSPRAGHLCRMLDQKRLPSRTFDLCGLQQLTPADDYRAWPPNTRQSTLPQTVSHYHEISSVDGLQQQNLAERSILNIAQQDRNLATTPELASQWMDLDTQSFVELEDVDDSWLDWLPPLSTTSQTTELSSCGMLASCSMPFYVKQCEPPIVKSSGADNFATEERRVASEVPPTMAASHESNVSSSYQAYERKRLRRLEFNEPKYMVLTRNYESVLRDGFKWRKYGQKSVKNNVYPRSYYKCSYEGCSVHKHVERIALDPCLILTTYRGQHNH